MITFEIAIDWMYIVWLFVLFSERERCWLLLFVNTDFTYKSVRMCLLHVGSGIFIRLFALMAF